MTIAVTSAVLEALIDAARAAYPNECCGLLFGTPDAVEAFRAAANVHPTPATHFEIDPQALIDAHRAMRRGGAARLVGYFHSHPSGPPEPSATDRARAARDAMIWAIIGQGRVRLWRAGGDGLVALPYRVTPA